MNVQSYSGTPVNTLGAISCYRTYWTHFIPDFEFYMVPRGSSLMAVQLFNALGFNIISVSAEAIISFASVHRHHFPGNYTHLTPTDTATCINGFKRKTLIDPNVKPTAEPQSPPPA